MVWWLHATLFYILFCLSYDTVQNMIGSPHTILYKAGVYERNWWSILITSHTVAVMRLGQARFKSRTGGL